MNLRKLLSLSVASTCIILLVSCTTVSKFEKRMDAKKGLSKTQLIEEMGIPDKEYKTNDFEIVEYNQSQIVSSSKSETSTVNGYLISTRTSVPYSIWCKLEFKLVDNVVTSYKYKGDMCRSR